jgi:hypothetical protein
VYPAVYPLRFSIVSCNLWHTERWDARAPALKRFLDLFQPDLLGVQELTPASSEFLKNALKNHDCVLDPFPGWSREGNIYWNRNLFAAVEHGAEEVGHLEPERRLFWVRLRMAAADKRIFASTAHLTAPTEKPEAETGASPRVGQLNRIVEALGRLIEPGEPAFFVGDMNDVRHPQRILKPAGFVTCFAALGLQSPPTFKCYPTAGVEPGASAITEAIDLIAANSASRAVSACVPNFYFKDSAVSDHWPVQAVYEVFS